MPTNDDSIPANDISDAFGDALKAEQSGCAAEMPKYQCHKKVWALKIKDIVFDHVLARLEERDTDGTAVITPADPGYAPFIVDALYLRKHNPAVGGYYVAYPDGYKSFSPAAAFEDGYTRI